MAAEVEKGTVREETTDDAIAAVDLLRTTPGIPAAYWLDLRAYEPVATARALSIPMFITRGGRDYQVPPAELAAWRTGLGDRAGVTVREYPSLNHLLLAGTGPSRPAEYAQPGVPGGGTHGRRVAG